MLIHGPQRLEFDRLQLTFEQQLTAHMLRRRQCADAAAAKNQKRNILLPARDPDNLCQFLMNRRLTPNRVSTAWQKVFVNPMQRNSEFPRSGDVT